MQPTGPFRALLQAFAHNHAREHLGHFEDVETRQRRRLSHYTGVCVAVLFLFLIPEYLLARDVFPALVALNIGLITPLLLITGFLARRRRRMAAENVLLVAFCTLPVCGFWILGSSSADPHIRALFVLSICCLMFVWYNATFGVRLWRPTLCYIIVFAAGLHMFLRLDHLSWRADLSLGLLLLTAGGMALLSNVFMQSDERGFVSEGQRLLDAIAAGRHKLWALDIPTGRVDVMRTTRTGPRRRSEMTQDQFLSFVHPDDREHVTGHLQRCIGRGESEAPCQYRLASRSAGDCRWYEGIGKVVTYGPAGEPVTLVGMTNNVTDSRQLTRQLEQQTEEIARTTGAKSDFLATMSHEIRTPLNGILGMAMLLTDADLTAGQREMVSIIRKSGADLLQTLNDVLDFSKMEAGKLVIRQAPFEIRKVAEHCMKSIEVDARNKSLAVGLSVAPEVAAWLSGDAIHLSIVLKHLLSNAAKFTRLGRIDLTVVALGPAAEGVETVRFDVRDTGIGIDRDSQKRLFVPFTQAHGQGFTKDSGAGLGLALSKRLVEMLGGSIACTSDPATGTCFSVTLPLSVDREPHIRETETGKALPVAGIRVLVAEDNPVNQVVLAKLLLRLGYKPKIVADGREALDAVKDGAFDIVFMDCEMPVLDGLEATRHIRALPGCQQLPIIALSAHSAEEHMALCAAAGMSDFLTKPITPVALYDQLRRWL